MENEDEAFAEMIALEKAQKALDTRMKRAHEELLHEMEEEDSLFLPSTPLLGTKSDNEVTTDET